MSSKLIVPSRLSSLSKLNRMLSGQDYNASKFFIIVDENSYNHCLPTLIANVSVLENAEFFEVPVGEEAKSLDVAYQLWTSLLESGADRQSVIINLGGGCVCDIGGFVAAGYQRGIRYFNIPTTLLCIVDAAIGGKTAINLDYTKNQVGFFWHPEAVCIHPDFLLTLPDDEYLNGFFEVVKTMYLSDYDFLYMALHHDEQTTIDANNEKNRSTNIDNHALINLNTLIHCATFKHSVVNADPTEHSVRKMLNFGHTFGHGIESFAHEKGIPMKHGIAVGIGMACELYLSVKKLGFSKKLFTEYCDEILSLIEVPRITLADTESILNYMRHDKKNCEDLILCVLLQDVGIPVVDVAISENEIRDTLLRISKMSSW